MDFVKFLAQVQGSRNAPTKVLYEGALQGNTDTYLRPNDLADQNKVPPPPPKIFRDYGATVELDRRQFSVIQPQVPRDPELEAINSYFNQKRVQDFANEQSRLNIDDVIRKQAEDKVSSVIKDEIDRRAGIRRSVLEATGFTPAEAEQEIVRSTINGINRRVVDARSNQIQDAIDLYYTLNNIPKPTTTPATNADVIASTTPSGTIAPPPEAPAPEAPAPEAPAAQEQAPPAAEEDILPFPEVQRAPENLMPEEPPARLSPPANLKDMNKDDIVEFIYNNNLVIDNLISTTYNVPATVTPRTGQRKAKDSFRAEAKKKTVAIVDLRSALVEAIDKKNRDAVGLQQPALGGGGASAGLPNNNL
jgi:hypothetical protein